MSKNETDARKPQACSCQVTEKDVVFRRRIAADCTFMLQGKMYVIENWKFRGMTVTVHYSPGLEMVTRVEHSFLGEAAVHPFGEVKEAE